MSDETKICRLCKVPKALDCFRVDRGYVRGECKECAAKLRRDWYAEDPKKCCEGARKWSKEHRESCNASKRAWRQNNPSKQEVYARKTNYGITDPEFQSLLIAQKDVCAICGGPPVGRKNLSVDHCHKSGKVRALLCGHCNTGLGSFKDDKELLLKAHAYLFLHS